MTSQGVEISDQTDGQVLRFGECELNLDEHSLRRQGEAVQLSPRIYTLLEYLVAIMLGALPFGGPGPTMSQIMSPDGTPTVDLAAEVSPDGRRLAIGRGDPARLARPTAGRWLALECASSCGLELLR